MTRDIESPEPLPKRAEWTCPRTCEGVSTGAELMDEPLPPEVLGRKLGLPSMDHWPDSLRALDSSSSDDTGEAAWATDLELPRPLDPWNCLLCGVPAGSKGSNVSKFSKCGLPLWALPQLAVLLPALCPPPTLSPWKVNVFFLVGLGVHARMSSCVSKAMGEMLSPLASPAPALPCPGQASLSSTSAGKSALSVGDSGRVAAGARGVASGQSIGGTCPLNPPLLGK